MQMELEVLTNLIAKLAVEHSPSHSDHLLFPVNEYTIICSNQFLSLPSVRFTRVFFLSSQSKHMFVRSSYILPFEQF